MSRRPSLSDDRRPPSGGGPEVPMLEQRVARLEDILVRLEPRIVEIALTGAKQSDLQAMRVDVAEIKGRLKGIEDRFGSLPTTWQMVSIIATMLVGIAGIVFVAGRYFSP